MMRLIDAVSPKSPQKQQSFHKMAANDNTVDVVLKLAVKMSASVDDTKTMVLNNCV